jgi:hypothetical protein
MASYPHARSEVRSRASRLANRRNTGVGLKLAIAITGPLFGHAPHAPKKTPAALRRSRAFSCEPTNACAINTRWRPEKTISESRFPAS